MIEVQLNNVKANNQECRPIRYTGSWVNHRAYDLMNSVKGLMLSASTAKNEKEKRRFTKLAYSKARACLYWYFWHRLQGTEGVTSKEVVQVLKATLGYDVKTGVGVAESISGYALLAAQEIPLCSSECWATKHRAFRALKVKRLVKDNE